MNHEQWLKNNDYGRRTFDAPVDSELKAVMRRIDAVRGNTVKQLGDAVNRVSELVELVKDARSIAAKTPELPADVKSELIANINQSIGALAGHSKQLQKLIAFL